MTNQSERFKRLSDLFDELVHLEGEERERAILDGCGGDDQMVGELRALLSADESGAPDGLLSGMVAAEAGALQNPDMQGRQLGSWRILETIGEGGMGTVYLAERGDGAYEAKAALKLVRGGIPSPLLTERFRVERQILAGLSHPGVAQLLDGGSTEDGTPYLVMEFVDGQPITDWCAEQGLDVPQRLELFLRVCDAVAYAHQALVAHRDIKPSNILVTRDGEPKLLDFGIAKLMDTVGDDDGVTQSYGIMTPTRPARSPDPWAASWPRTTPAPSRCPAAVPASQRTRTPSASCCTRCCRADSRSRPVDSHRSSSSPV